MKSSTLPPFYRLTHFAIFLTLFVPSLVFGQVHPRLLIEATELPELRDRITREPYASMMAELESFAENDTTVSAQYGETVAAVNCGFLYLLTGDDTWAAKARSYAETRLTDTGNSHGWDRDIKGLALYWHGRGMALAYDFCHDAPSWNTAAGLGSTPAEPFVDYVRDRLKAQADRIYEDGGNEQNRNAASNWQNNRFASAGLIYLAIEESLTEGEKTRIHGCMDKVETYLVENMGDSPDSRGFNIEAIGYQMYPWSFTGPFAIAAERLGYGRMADAAPAASAYALWNVYSAALKIPHIWGDHYGSHLDFGDDNNTHRGEGCYGLAFYFCPDFLHPGLRYWYDRLVGELGDQTWDRERHGLMYSILYYRDDIEAVMPDSIKEWSNAYLETGGNGYFTFRNAYAQGAEIIAQIYAKFRGNKGHSGPDALSFRIAGLDAPFAVGGGRYGPDINAADTGKKQDAYLRSMNTLYPVDPENELTISGNSGELLGVPQSFEDGGGSVSLHIDRNNVDTLNHTRRFLADYSEASGADAVYVISDTSDNGNWWQFCQVDLDSGVQAISVDGNSFTVTNPNGTLLTGTVIYPASNLRWKTGSRIRGSDYGYYGVRYDTNEYVHFQSDDGDYLVVLTLNESGETPPVVTPVAGSGANDGRVLQIGDLTVTVDGDTISRGMDLAQPPSVLIEQPQPLVQLSPGPANLDVDGRTFPGSAPLDSVEVYYGPVSEFLGEGGFDPQSGRFSFTIPELERGHHIFRVKAVDTDGLSRYSDYIPVSVHATQPPRAWIETPANGAILEQLSAVSIAAEAADPDDGVASMDIRVNGISQPPSGSHPWTTFLDTSQPGAFRIEAIATDASGESDTALSDVFVSQGQLPEPWIHFDVGDVGSSGAASLSGDLMTINAYGSDIWDGADEMHFAFQPFSGNGEIVLRVTGMRNTHQWAKAGPVFRASAQADAAYVGLFATPGNGVTLQRRSTTGASSQSTRIDGITTPVWLRLVREGNAFSGYMRTSETVPWTLVGSYTVELPKESIAGIAATSHNDTSEGAASFDQISFITTEPAPAPLLELYATPGGDITAGWSGEPGRTYQMMISTGLESWAPYRLPMTADTPLQEIDLSELSAPFFLRMEAQ